MEEEQFDYIGAIKSGYTPEEIQGYISENYDTEFDLVGAKGAGYSDDEIQEYFSTSLKKKQQTQPQKEAITEDSSTVAEPLQESGGETNYLVNDTAVTRDDLERNLSNDEFIQKVRSGEFNIQVSNDPALEKELENKIKPPSDKAIDKTIQNISGNDESTVKILGRSFQSGLADLSADIYRTPEFIYDVAVNGYNKLLELQDMILPESMESRKIATSEELSEMTGIDNKYAENLESYAEKKNEINEKYRKPIFESIKQGNISDATLNTAMSVTESLPFMLSMMIPSAAGVKAGKMFLGTTAVMGAGRKQELSEEEGISETQKNANALLYGMAEATDVLIGSGAAGRAIGDVFNKSGKKSAVEFAEDVVAKMVKEKPYLSPFTEGFQEAFTSYVQNLSDRATGVDKNKDLTEGVIDAFIVGATMGGMTGGVVQASKITSKLLNNKQDINDINELTKSPQVINEVTGQIDTLINTGDLTEKKGSEIKEKIIKDVTVNASIPDNIQGDDRVKAIELQKKYIEVKANQEQASDAFKPLYKGELNELEVQLQELALKAKADANSKESQATPLQEEAQKADIEKRKQENSKRNESEPMREQGEQKQSEGTSDSDMSKDDKAGIQDGKETKKEEVENAKYDAFVKEKYSEVYDDIISSGGSVKDVMFKLDEMARGEGLSKDNILNEDIDKNSELIMLSELDTFVGEDRVGSRKMVSSRENIDKLKEDISKNGFKEPIIIQYTNNGKASIIEGNHRYVAAKELGYEKIPVVFRRVDSLPKNVNSDFVEITPKDKYSKSGKDLGFTSFKIINSDYKQKQKTSKQQDESSGAKKPQQKQSTAKTATAETKQSKQEKENVKTEDNAKETKEIPTGKVTPKNKEGFKSVFKRMFGLDDKKAAAVTEVYDVVAGNMAKRAGETKDGFLKKIGFKKGEKAPEGSLKQDGNNLTWRSTAKEGLGKINQKNATPEQWVKTITEKGGKGTAQELEWIGLSDFLNNWKKENKAKSVPKEVVEQYINDNQIEIVEVSKGQSITWEQTDNKWKYKDYEIRFENGEDYAIYYDGKNFGSYASLDIAKQAMEDYISDRTSMVGDTKHSQYTLEGGENYREVLLTLPKNKKSDQKFYKKSHFDEANILAHLRLNERTLPNGERVLFIEEVQSDWAQEGKKKGFDDKKQDLTPRYRRLDNGIDFWEIGDETQKGEVYFDPDRVDETVYTARAGNKMQDFDNRDDAIKWAQDNIPKQRGAIPDMPYKKTDQWVGMAMRRVMQMAAQEGFDRVAWVTGEQSAERYDLSKQVDRVEVADMLDGNRSVYISMKDNSDIQLFVDPKTGKILQSTDKGIDGKMLEDVVGKEISNKILNLNTEKESVISGDGLKVGGEGMKAFYNSILPSQAKKEARRFDKKANVEVVEIEQKKKDDRYKKLIEKKKEFQDKADKSSGFVRDGYLEDVKRTQRSIDKEYKSSKQLSIAITPEMRMNLNKAVPLFQGEQGAMLAQDGNYIIYALTNPNVSTPLHELAHVYEHYLTDVERKQILNWAGKSKWDTSVSEKFARGFERYLATGKAPNSKLQQLFDSFKEWLTDIYNGIKGSDIDIELNSEMKSIYDSMLSESKPQQEKEAKERRGNLKDIHKRKKAIIAKFKSGKFFNKAMVVSDFIGSLPRLSRIKDNELLKEILEEMKALTSSRVADVDENRIKALTEKVKKAEFENEKSTTSLQRAEAIIKGLAQKAKSVTNISNLVSLNLDIERAENELDNAVQQGEFGDLEDGSDSKKKYDALLEKIEQATEELSSPKKSTSYGMMIAFKGDITRAKNRINKALKDGQITEDRANQLKNDLEAAKKQLEEETKEFIQNRSKEARENLKGITISDLEKEHGLSRPAKIVLEGFLNQIKNYEPKSASDAEVLYKISDALSKGFIPYNEIGQMIKNIKSDEASNIIIPTISKIIDSVKKKASYEISRLLGEQMGAFKSEQLGEAFSETKVFEKFIYSPIQQAIKKSNQASLEMATELGNKMKKAQGRWGKRVLDSLLGKNSSRRAAIKVGVIKNILNEAALKGTGEMSGFQMESFASDGSKVEVGSRDWLGIILGKEAAVNDLNGDIKDKTKEAILAGKMLIPFQQKLGVFKRAVIKIKGQFGFHNTDIDIMNDIWESLPKKANGAVDLDAIVNDPNSYMNEMEAAYFEAITDAFNSSYEFIEVANMLKGMPIQRIDDYYKRSRFMSSDKELGYTEAGIHSNNLRIKAGSANIRTSNALGAIDFNSVNVAIQNIVESPRYFYIDQSGREVNSTLNKVSQQTEHKNVIEGIKQDTAASLIYNFTRGKTPALISKLISARYAYSLLDPIRVVGLESVGLFLRGSFTNPKSLLSLGSRDVVSKMEKDFGLKIIKKATGQIEAQNTKISTKDGKTPIRKTGLGEMLMGIPENITSVMFFMPSFNESFFAITGKEFDSKRFLNDKQYLEENRKYIEESIDLANIELERVVGSETRFGDRRYVRYAPKKIDELVGGTLSVKADETAGRWLAFMSNYVYREGSVIFKPIKQVSQGKAPTLKAAYASGGAIIGGMYYTYMSALYYGISRILSGDDDEKEDVLKDWSDLFGVNFKDGKINVEKMAMKSVGVFLDQVFFYGVARYGQAIRTVGIVGLSLLNDLGKRTNNKFMEKETREALKTKFYTDPVNILSTYGLREFAAKNVPMLDMAVRLFSGMMENYKDILDKDIDKLDNDELNLLISLSALHNSINAVLAVKYGTQIPMTPKVKFMLKKEIDNMKKNTSRNSKKPKNLED